MTQKSEIIDFLLNNPSAPTSDIQVVFSKFPAPSVRRVLSELRKEGINIKRNPEHLNKIKESIKEKLRKVIEAPEEEEIYDREIVKVLVYCPNEPHRAGFGHKLFALTYGNDPDDDHFDQLVEALQLAEEIEQGAFDLDFNFREDRGNRLSLNKFSDCLQASQYGYDNEVQTDNPPFTFPDIEVGEE